MNIEIETVNCILCGRDDPEIIHIFSDDWLNCIPGQYPLVACRECGLRYIRVRPTSSQMIQFYSSESMQSGLDRRSYITRALHSLRAELRRRAISRVIAPGRALDIGCGSGEFLLALRKAGWEVWGTEIDPRRAQEARSLSGAEIVLGAFEDAGFENDRFDLVTLWHVLEHFNDPGSPLTEARRVLRPGGILGLVLPNASSLEAQVFTTEWSGYVVPWANLYNPLLNQQV